MEGYLGETILKVEETQYENYTKEDWALLWIQMYGGADGHHHKDWVLDNVARILQGTPVIITLAEWVNGHREERLNLDEPPKEYWEWVEKSKYGEDGPDTYSYEFGIAP